MRKKCHGKIDPYDGEVKRLGIYVLEMLMAFEIQN